MESEYSSLRSDVADIKKIFLKIFFFWLTHCKPCGAGKSHRPSVAFEPDEKEKEKSSAQKEKENL